MSYASKTKTSSAVTEGEIKNTLLRFGASGFMSGQQQGADGTEMAMVAFVIHGMKICFTMFLPSPQEKRFTHTGERGFERPAAKARAEWEQACKAKWRALLLAIKAKLVAVDEGISTVEQEFLAWVVLPNGQTAGDAMLPRIRLAASTGEMPRLTWDGQ